MIDQLSYGNLTLDVLSLTLYHWIRYLVRHLRAVDARLADGHGVSLGDNWDDGDSEADLVHEFEVRGADPAGIQKQGGRSISREVWRQYAVVRNICLVGFLLGILGSF